MPNKVAAGGMDEGGEEGETVLSSSGGLQRVEEGGEGEVHDAPSTSNTEKEDEEIPEKYKTGDKRKPWRFTDDKGNVYTYFDSPMWKAAVFVLLLEMLERFSFYSLQPLYNRYLTSPVFARMSVSEASSTIKLMAALGYLFPLLSAAVADSFLGTFTGIIVTAVIYLGALTLMTLSGSPALYQSWMTPVYFFVWFPLGFGGIKSLVGTMGANQYHPVIHSDRLMRYWLQFYVVVNLGSLASTPVNIYANTVGDELWKAFAIPTVAFACAMVVFLVGSPRYVKRRPLGSSLVQIVRVVFGCLSRCPPDLESQKRTSRGGGEFSPSIVDDTRRVLSLVPLIFVGTFFFYMSYWQLDTYVLFQGYEMKPAWGGLIESNVLNSFMNPLCLVVFAFLVERFLLPCLSRRGIVPNQMDKFMIGCCCAGVALVYAAGIDWLLKQNWSPDREQCPSVLLLGPVYGLIAIGEVFAAPASLDLAYRLAPPSTKAIAIGLHGLCNGMVPNFVSSALALLTKDFQKDKYGCVSRNDEECPTPVRDPSGMPTWDYPSVRIWIIYLIAAAFPICGLLVIQCTKPYYRRLMSLHSAEGVGDSEEEEEDEDESGSGRRTGTGMGLREGSGNLSGGDLEGGRGEREEEGDRHDGRADGGSSTKKKKSLVGALEDSVSVSDGPSFAEAFSQPLLAEHRSRALQPASQGGNASSSPEGLRENHSRSSEMAVGSRHRVRPPP